MTQVVARVPAGVHHPGDEFLEEAVAGGGVAVRHHASLGGVVDVGGRLGVGEGEEAVAGGSRRTATTAAEGDDRGCGSAVVDCGDGLVKHGSRYRVAKDSSSVDAGKAGSAEGNLACAAWCATGRAAGDVPARQRAAVGSIDDRGPRRHRIEGVEDIVGLGTVVTIL